MSLKLSDTRVYEPQIRARIGTIAHYCVGHEVGHKVGHEVDHEAGHEVGAKKTPIRTQWCKSKSAKRPHAYHSMDYKSLLKSQRADRQLTLRPFMVLIGSRDPPNLWLVVHRVEA